MGRVKCSYCGSYIDDSLANCPHCGAVNSSMVRFADKTPKTIEELQKWYRDRNLPPEDVTRFYIGKDVKQARAFGIFEKGGKYTVYKNKSDGTRAIRYSGTDQAYAVNEIYNKLKEEILNQKKRNLAGTSSASRSTARPASSSFQSAVRKTSRGSSSPKLKRLIIIGIIIILLIIGSTADEPLPDRYYNGGDLDSVYYVSHQDKYEWWKYDEEADNWGIDVTYEVSSTLPVGIKKDHETTYEDLLRAYDIPIPDCPNSREFVDQHHPYISPGYYVQDDSVYYYLNNSYGTNSGWYTYDDDGWDYYCDTDDADLLGEDLWYNTDDYYTTSDFNTLDSDKNYYFYDDEDWITDFSDTDFYQTYQQDISDYNASKSSTYNSYDDDDDSWSSWDDDSWSDWDDDDSWDWDSGSDWDSGWSDWDSDW